ncbi:MAG: hypothetical protein PWP23_1620 [Candidatus Sumerlaeota bacterium]|nr:hypothetical protein [Candidatus Sumerlaeota bacterium]
MLDGKRVLRSGRWRVFVLLELLLGIYLQRREAFPGATGSGFGPGSPADFPGGVLGLQALGVLIAAGALVLAADLAGQPDHYHSSEMEQARPAGGLPVQLARVSAVSFSMALAAALLMAFPFLPLFRSGFPELIAPIPLWFAGVAFPLIVLGAACGVFGRTVAHTEAGALAFGGLLAVPGVWYRLWDSAPGDLFTYASSQLGVLLPMRVLAEDALATAGMGLAALGAAVFLYRVREPRTPVRPGAPVRRSSFPVFRGVAFALAGRLRICGGGNLGVAAVLVVVGGYLVAPVARMDAHVFSGSDPRIQTAQWNAMSEPPGAVDGIVEPPRIVQRRLLLPAAPSDPLIAELTLQSVEGTQELAAVTFGPLLEVHSVTASHGAVEVLPRAASRSLGAVVLRFDPPLSETDSTTVSFRLAPEPTARRSWMRAFHPRYATWRFLPLWYGEGMRLRYHFNDWQITRQAAPYALVLPADSPRTWHSGTATEETVEGRVVLSDATPDIPAAPYAARVVRIEETHGDVPVAFVVFPEHAELAKALQTIYGRRFERFGRAFGTPPSVITFHEVPGAAQGGATTVPSGILDYLSELLPAYDDYKAPTAPEFDIQFGALQRKALDQVWERNFSGFEFPEFLRDTWVRYLHEFAFAGGVPLREYEARRRDFVLVPWEWVSGERADPFDILPRDEPGYRGPALARPRTLPPAPPERLLALHHMLRGVLGDDAYRAFLGDVLTARRGQVLRLEDFRTLAAAHAPDRDMERFFTQWMETGVLPTYVLERAEVVLSENPETRRLEYTTRIVAANRGDGFMRVPLTLRTDGDRVDQHVALDADEATTLTLTTRSRPLSVELDPQGWILQMLPLDARTRKPRRPVLYLKNVKELAPGEPLPWASEANPGQDPAGQVSSSPEK